MCDDYHITLLAEERLNNNNYRKYNDNAGGVDGNQGNQPCDLLPVELVPVVPVALGVGGMEAIGESDEESDEGIYTYIVSV